MRVLLADLITLVTNVVSKLHPLALTGGDRYEIIKEQPK